MFSAWRIWTDVTSRPSARGCLNGPHFQYCSCGGDIGHDRQPADTGHKLAQEFQALSRCVCLLDRQSGNVATWARQTRDNAGTNPVDLRSKYDREQLGCLLRRKYRGLMPT